MDISPLKIKFLDKIVRFVRNHYNFFRKIIPSQYFQFHVHGGILFLNPAESKRMLDRIIGYYETNKVQTIKKTLNQGHIFLDVGANKGFFTILAANLVSPTGHVYAFEPHPNNFQWLTKSVKSNNYDHVTCINKAAGNYSGSARMYLGQKSGHHTLSPENQTNHHETIKVDIVQIDEFVRAQQITNQIHSIKIDVEGEELNVLSGAKNTIEENEHIHLFIDLHPTNGANGKKIFQWLQSRSFSLFPEDQPYSKPLQKYSGETAIVAYRK